MKLKKYEFKKRRKNQANLEKYLKPELTSQTRNLWISLPRLNQKAQLPTNIMLKDTIEKKNLIGKKKPKKDEIVKKRV
jgi:hypothetical protein